MSFFDEVTPEPRDLPTIDAYRSAAFAPRASVLPRSLPWEQVITENSDVAIALSAVQVWISNLTVELSIYSSAPIDDKRLLLFPDRQRSQEGSPDVDGPRVGVLFSDGRYATNLRKPGFPRPHERGLSAEYPVLSLASSGGGGGGGSTGGSWHFRQVLDVWPLPPAGPLAIIFAWPGEHFVEHAIEMNGDDIVSAASHCVEIIRR